MLTSKAGISLHCNSTNNITEHPWAYLNAHVQCQATQEATEALCAHDAFFWLYFGFLMNYAFGET